MCLEEMCLLLLMGCTQSKVASSLHFLSSVWTRLTMADLFEKGVFWMSELEGNVKEEVVIDNWDASRTHVQVLNRIFTVKKQFRGNRLIFYNLWDFMWRVF